MAILISLRCFALWIKGDKSQLKVQSDSTAAIGVTLELASPSITMSALAAEIAIDFDGLGIEIVTSQHVPGILDFVADALSRLSRGAKLPSSLASVRRIECPTRSPHFFRTWG